MWTNNINARRMLHDAFSYGKEVIPASAPAPKAPRGKARVTPAVIEEQFESDSESSFAGSEYSSSTSSSTSMVGDVPVPPVGAKAPRIGPTKSEKPKKPKAVKKTMAKPKADKPLPPPEPPKLVVKEPVPVPEMVKVSKKKLTAPPAPVADLPPAKVDLPEKIVLAQKLEQPEKKKRAPSAYNKFVSGHMKAGKSMVEIAGLWKAEKAAKA
jgi:hypothetical protein